jgi:hypothetical protein
MRTLARCGYLLGSLVVALVVSSSIDAAAAPLTCASVHCIGGTHCVNTPKGPKCVPNLSCASVHCAGGTHCVDMATGPKCVPNLTCATVLCKLGAHCVDTPTGPKCVGGPPPPYQRKY